MFMDRLTRFIEERVAPPLIKFSQLRYIQVLQRTGLGVMSLLVIGSVFLLIASFPTPNNVWINFLGDFRMKIAAVSGIGTTFISFYTVITTSFGLVEYYNKNKGESNDIILPVILSLASFFILNPVLSIKTAVDTDGVISFGAAFSGIDSTYLGARGVFTAIIVGIVTVEIYRFFVNRKIVIKMPEGVPPMVAQSFASLIPGTVVIVFWWLVSTVLGWNIPSMIEQLLRPLINAGDSPFVMVSTTFLNRLLWSVGIHGSNIVGSVAGTIWTQITALNLDAYNTQIAQNVLPHLVKLPHTYTSVFIDNYIWTGLFPLAVCLVMSKSPRLKALGSLSIVAALFNIGEPIIFGLPIMLNPLMMIPFIFSYVIIALVSVAAVSVGLIPVPVANISWITPAPLKTFLATNGSISAVIFVLLAWVFIFVTFYPFVKALEKKDLETIE